MYTRLMARVEPRHKKALRKEARARKPKVSDSTIIREMFNQRYPKA